MTRRRPTSDEENIRQDEDISAAEFSAAEARDPHDFGNWPELAGLAFTVFMVWIFFAFTG